MSERSEKIRKSIRLNIAAQIAAAVTSNPNFKGKMTSFAEYVRWADLLMEENEKFDKEKDEDDRL